MTAGFDLDEIERELMLDDLSWWRMNRVTKAGHSAITAMLTEIRELRAENARLKEMTATNRQAWDNALELGIIPERHRNTVQIMSDGCRAALGEPQ